MKLVSATINNYRSIVKARKIPIGDYTVLIGPNNQGKSNILGAISIAIQVLTQYRRVESVQVIQSNKLRLSWLAEEFSWRRDFPIDLQDQQPDGQSVFLLEFDLTAEERAEFLQQTGSRLNTNLNIRIKLSRRDAELSFAKQGKGGKKLTLNIRKVVDFIVTRLEFLFIPAVRPASSAQRVVNRLVNAKMARLKENPEYAAAVQALRALEAPEMAALSASITTALKEFIPTIQAAMLSEEVDRGTGLTRGVSKLVIDDGAPTDLSQKGDGVQSIAAIALMKLAFDEKSATKGSVIAIEEPESHLHSNAIHALSKSIRQVATTQQVILTTHSPLFVDRLNVKNNIIVNNGTAGACKKLHDLRRILGIKASDNLESASAVLLVEGDDDFESVTAILRGLSSQLEKFLFDGALKITSMGGASNLPQHATFVRGQLCELHAFMDRDQAGLSAVKRAEELQVIESNQVTFAALTGRSETEFEDLLDEQHYLGDLGAMLSVDLSRAGLRKVKGKWSSRLEHRLTQLGANWNDQVKSKAKRLVSERARAVGPAVLTQDGRHVMETLCERLLRICGANT